MSTTDHCTRETPYRFHILACPHCSPHGVCQHLRRCFEIGSKPYRWRRGFLSCLHSSPDREEGANIRYECGRLQKSIKLMLWVPQGDAVGCREYLSVALSALHAAGVHPLHYHCLEAYCLLTSACLAAATPPNSTSTVACAAAYALGAALAFDPLVRAGGTLLVSQSYSVSQ